MSHTFTLARRAARFRAITAVSAIFASAACDGDRRAPLDPEEMPSAPVEAQSEATAATLASVSFAGGIPIGTAAQPTSAFGSLYNGAKLTLKPWEVIPALLAIKARGGRVILMLAGNHAHYVDANGHFSFSKWKARVDRFRTKNLSSYIKDGTIIGHFLLDEPDDPNNWNGRLVSQSTVEEMAKYSKQIWPSMPTIIRSESSYMAKWSGTYRYLDAAWAQYVQRKGNVGDFLSRNVTDAKRKGLALVVGLNLLKGGLNQVPMTATQVKSWGSSLLSSSYPCAFISWQYDATYLSSRSIKEAMAVLRRKAQNRTTKTCRGF
jgi:hypothetical protein